MNILYETSDLFAFGTMIPTRLRRAQSRRRDQYDSYQFFRSLIVIIGGILFFFSPNMIFFEWFDIYLPFKSSISHYCKDMIQ